MSLVGPLTQSYALPADVFLDYLEDFMLFSFIKGLGAEAGVPLPQDITLFAYNDLSHWAIQNLPAEHQDNLQSYLASSVANMQTGGGAALPSPLPLSPHATEAELLAFHLLEERRSTLWPAVRALLRCLPWDGMTRWSPSADPLPDLRNFTLRLGAFYRVVPGLFQQTLRHPNVTLLLNQLVAHCHPKHRWSSLELLLNTLSPPHRDSKNTDDGTLLLQLSVNEGGLVWVEDADGTVYQDVPGQLGLIGGTEYDLHGLSLLFRADKLWHATQPWPAYSRVVLAAYTVKGIERFSTELREQLERLGYRLPYVANPPVSSLLPPTVGR